MQFVDYMYVIQTSFGPDDIWGDVLSNYAHFGAMALLVFSNIYLISNLVLHIILSCQFGNFRVWRLVLRKLIVFDDLCCANYISHNSAS